MLFQKTEASCNGKYLKADPSNGQCTENLKVVNKVSVLAPIRPISIKFFRH